MKRFFALAFVFLGFIGSFALAGCGSNSNSTPGSTTISVSITSPATPPTIQQGQTVNITAAVANDSSNQGVTWSLSGQGTLSNQTATTVTYNAPASVTTKFTATVTATSVADTSATAPLPITVTPPPAISVTITNKFTNIAAGAAAVTLEATVQNDSSNSGVSWTLTAGGAACSPTCGGLSAATTSSVTYTPPTSVPGTPNNAPTITATSVADNTKSDTNPFTITTSGGGGGGVNAGLLKGQYAFLVQGYDSALAASITANGTGSITSGTEDIVAPGAAMSGADLSISSGSYTVGSDDRGTITYKDSNGNTFTFAIALGSVTGGVATQGRMIEFDTNPLEMTGSLALQNASAFSTTALSGNYAFGLSGWDSTPDPQAVAGSFTASSASLTNGLFDQNDAGSLTPADTFTGNLGTVSSDGRASFSLNVTGSANASTGDIYVVSAGEWFAISGSTASNFVLAGQMLQQTGGPYSLSSLSGNAILVDQSANGAPAPHANLGLLTFDSTNGTGTYSLDTVDGGTGGGTDSPVSGTTTYALDSAANGRFTLTPQGASPLILYMIGPNQAFMVGTSTSSADFGTIEGQTGGPYSNSSEAGTYYFGTLPLMAPGTAGTPPPPLSVTSGVFTLSATGAATGTFDSDSSGVPTAGTALSETYTFASNGRGTSTSGDSVLYVVSPSKIYFLSLGSENPTIGVVQK